MVVSPLPPDLSIASTASPSPADPYTMRGISPMLRTSPRASSSVSSGLVLRTRQSARPVQSQSAAAVGERDIEADGRGVILAGEGKGAGAEGCHQRLEVRLVGHLDEEPDEGDIVLHDEKRPVARLDRLAIVPRLVQHPWRLVRVARRLHR